VLFVTEMSGIETVLSF